MNRALLSIMLAASLAAGNIHADTHIKWLETVHDFGAFDENDGKVFCDFRFVNEGSEPVAIRAARASCGCTTPSYTKDPIEPGDTATIQVAYNPTGRPGRFSKTVKIDISGEATRQTLMIQGVVIGSSNTLRSRYPVEVGVVKLRNSVIPFGTVLKGKAKAAYLEVYNASHEPITPKWVDTPDYLRITASADTIPPGEQTVYSMVLTPSATALYGILTDSLTLDVPGEQPVKIDITAILEEDFSTLTPSARANAPVVKPESDRVDFGEFPAADGPRSESFKITNDGKNDLLLRRVYTLDPGITVKCSSEKIKHGKSATVTVTVDPSQLPSPVLNGRIQIITNDPDNPLTIVRAVGIPQ